MALPRQDVEFRACDGTILRGWLYAREETSPCIIMTPGLGGTRHFLLPQFASAFHDAGYAVLLYDNRNWGDSDGLPRQESNPPLQQADYYDAFNYAAALSCVDKDNIVYWGSSFSGGNAIYAAAIDKRIKAAIIQCPAVSGLDPPTVPLIAADRESAEKSTSDAMFPTKDADDIMALQQTCGSRWENYITSQTQLHMLSFEGQSMIHRISPTPLLFVIPGNDVLVSTASQMDAFKKARGPKHLHYLEGCGHFDLYRGDYFEQNIKAQIEFLKQYIK